MTHDPTAPVTIDPDGIYSDAMLVIVLGMTTRTIATARRDGRLRHMRQGRRILYRGQWILDWLEHDAKPGHKGGAK